MVRVNTVRDARLLRESSLSLDVNVDRIGVRKDGLSWKKLMSV